MGQDEIFLQVLAVSGNAEEQKNAAVVLRLLQKGKHWVLVTLLLSNVITNETLPIILDRSLGGGIGAVVSSTVLIGRRCPDACAIYQHHANTKIPQQSFSARSFPSPSASDTGSLSAHGWHPSS